MSDFVSDEDLTSLESLYKGNNIFEEIPIYYWNNSSQTNTWSESSLNRVNINTNYLNTLSSEWQEKIIEHIWYVGGTEFLNVYGSQVKTAYDYEVGPNKKNTTYNAKIGLIYASDYGYAASPENWITDLGSYNISANTDNNWMFMGFTDWTISRDSSRMNYAFRINDIGNVTYNSVSANSYGRTSVFLFRI